jgi:hypothetical protein
MSLNFSYGKVKNYKEVCFEAGEDGKMKGSTNVLIWATMSIGMSSITEKNYVEFWVRFSSAHAVFNLYHGKAITLDDIKAHIGLTTNANTYTSTAFMKNMVKNIEREEKRRERDKEELKEVA